MVAREYTHGIARRGGIPWPSPGTRRELSRRCFIMKRGQGITCFDLSWCDHLRNGQGMDPPRHCGGVNVANRRVRRAEVNANDETTYCLRHCLLLLRCWGCLSVLRVCDGGGPPRPFFRVCDGGGPPRPFLTDTELQLPAPVR